MVGPQSTYLLITAMPMVSAFTQPYEDWTTRSETEPQHVFVTKHNSSNLFSSIEESVIPYLGFLPQVKIRLYNGNKNSVNVKMSFLNFYFTQIFCFFFTSAHLSNRPYIFNISLKRKSS